VSERKVIIFEKSAWHLVFVQTLIMYNPSEGSELSEGSKKMLDIFK